GGRITPQTLDRIREVMGNKRTVGARAALLEGPPRPPPAPAPLPPARPGPPRRAPAPVAPAQPGPRDPQRNFRFFDNRQKYLLFVSTCSEKWVVASRVP